MKRIDVISLDRIGLVGDISNVIRRLNGSIVSHTAKVVADDNNTLISYFTAEIDFNETAENDDISRRLRRIKNVRQVSITDL